MIQVVIELEGQKSHKPHYRLIQLMARRSYFGQRKEELDMRGESEITSEEKEDLNSLMINFVQ